MVSLVLAAVCIATPAQSPALPQALATFLKLHDVHPYVKRNRALALHLQSLLRSKSLKAEHRKFIESSYAKLQVNRGELVKTAKALDTSQSRKIQRELRIDVLRLLVDLVGKRQVRFHSKLSNYFEAYYSYAEGRRQMFRVALPPGFDPAKKYALLVQVPGRVNPSRQFPFIRITPTGRGVWGYRSMSRYDVLESIKLMKMGYKIDEDRVYLIGYSAGATGIMHTAAQRPDIFAGLMPFVAFGNDLPLAHFRNLPFRCQHGTRDWTSSIGNVRAQFIKLRKLKYEHGILNEHKNAGHGIGMSKEMLGWLLSQKRTARPKHIVYSCEHPRDGRVYWLRIVKLSDSHQVARVEARLSKDEVQIKTRNVRWLHVDRDVVSSTKRIVLDGQRVRLKVSKGSLHPELLNDQEGKWQPSFRAGSIDGRRHYAAGAAANLFQGEPLLIVYGTLGDKETTQFLRRAAFVLSRSAGPTWRPAAVRFPVIADTKLTATQRFHHNLLLIGSAANHAVLKRIEKKLPFVIRGKVLHVTGRRPLELRGSVLGSFHYNPENKPRLLYVLSPFVDGPDRVRFLANPRKFLAGSDGFKMIDQPDLLVRRADLTLRREMQWNRRWRSTEPRNASPLVPKRFADRKHLAYAHMKVMRQLAKVDFALWWGPDDKGSFGGYDFNWLSGLDPTCYSKADYLVRRREVETLTASLTGSELKDFNKRWISKNELLTWPAVPWKEIRDQAMYRVCLPMDLVVKLGTRRKTLSHVAPGPNVMPKQVAKEIWP